MSTLILEAWQRAFDIDDVKEMGILEETIREQPFADVVHAMLRYAVAPGASRIFADRTHLLPILTHERLQRLVA
jgi:hypothetical protein